ncbi:hypothetical protein CCHR01_12930 [Colletotrichum chrysophilum]|uniref:Uncharacterized protein n=1 Tax=Colletotrichum chrysophilum TaxID=1836956 RepID=A0AAD9AAD2_9PEZI|nr:hypothetical protein CCHR01_12930 [Colletotrichum chrysophilum]
MSEDTAENSITGEDNITAEDETGSQTKRVAEKSSIVQLGPTYTVLLPLITSAGRKPKTLTMQGYVGVLLCSPNVLISGLSQSPVLYPGMDICLDLESSSAWVEDCATRRTVSQTQRIREGGVPNPKASRMQSEAEAGKGYFALESWVSLSAIYNWLVAVAEHVDLQVERHATGSAPRPTSCGIAGITTRATSRRGHVEQTARNDSSSSRRRSIPRPFRSPATYYSQPSAAEDTVTGTSRTPSSTSLATPHTVMSQGAWPRSLSMGEEQRATKRRGLCVGWNVKCVDYDLLQKLLLLALPTSRSIGPLAEQHHRPTTLRDDHPLPFRKLPSVLAAQCHEDDLFPLFEIRLVMATIYSSATTAVAAFFGGSVELPALLQLAPKLLDVSCGPLMG